MKEGFILMQYEIDDAYDRAMEKAKEYECLTGSELRRRACVADAESYAAEQNGNPWDGCYFSFLYDLLMEMAEYYDELESLIRE